MGNPRHGMCRQQACMEINNCQMFSNHKVYTADISCLVYRLGQKFLDSFFSRPNQCVTWFGILSLLIMIFNNHPSVSILNMTGIRRSVMHQWTVSWRHVWLVKNQVWPRKEWEFYSSYKGKFWIQFIHRHATSNYLTCLYHRYRHNCFLWQWSPLELYFMMTRLS